MDLSVVLHSSIAGKKGASSLSSAHIIPTFIVIPHLLICRLIFDLSIDYSLFPGHNQSACEAHNRVRMRQGWVFNRPQQGVCLSRGEKKRENLLLTTGGQA
jgi:hypothetical protein